MPGSGRRHRGLPTGEPDREPEREAVSLVSAPKSGENVPEAAMVQRFCRCAGCAAAAGLGAAPGE